MQKMTTKSIQPLSWLIWFFAAFFYLYEMVLRVSPSVMSYGIRSEYDLTASSFGILTSFYYYAYVLLQIPSGLLVDRYGVRLVITISCLMCALGSLAFALSDVLLVAKASRFLIGAGSACAFVCCLKIASQYFPKNKFSLIAALSNMFGTLGGAIAGKPLAMLVQTIGWRSALLWLAVVGFILAIVCWSVITNQRQSQGNEVKVKLTPRRLKAVLANPCLLILGIVGGLMYVPISAFAELWSVPYVMNALSVTNSDASSITPLIFIGMAVGAPIIAQFVPYSSDLRLMKLCALLLAILFVLIMFISNFTLLTTAILFFITGFFVGGQVLTFSVVMKQVDDRIAATAMAITNALIMMSGVIFQPLFGYVLEFMWNGKIDAAGVAIYDIASFQVAVSSISICMVLSFIALYYVKYRHAAN